MGGHPHSAHYDTPPLTIHHQEPVYDPAVHLGGVQYLFVRGMVELETPPGCGVFDWQPPASLVVALSDLLGGRS